MQLRRRGRGHAVETARARGCGREGEREDEGMRSRGWGRRYRVERASVRARAYGREGEREGESMRSKGRGHAVETAKARAKTRA